MSLLSGAIKKSPGAKANKTGNTLERFVEQLLQENGYEQLLIKDCDALVFLANLKSVKKKSYVKQFYVGETIYKTPRYCDFFIVNDETFTGGLIIECKWQQAGGSVDEKYPFVVKSIDKTGIITIILLDGGGYRKGAETWLKTEIKDNKLVKGVWSMVEFQTQVNNGLLD